MIRAVLPVSTALPIEARDEDVSPAGPPHLTLALGELTAGWELYRLVAGSHRLRKVARADPPGATVIDVPGWGAPEAVTAPLRAYLRRLGYDARGWGFGLNRGDVRGDVRRLEQHLDATIDPTRPVRLVGWSLGGVIVREVARRRPDLVGAVVTFGSPVVGGTAHTVGAHLEQAVGAGPAASEKLAGYTERGDLRDPIEVPVTVILSRRDGIVSWHSCVDRYSPRVQHVEVGSTHLGMVLDPDVWTSVARGLAVTPEGPDAEQWLRPA
jgi:pimeloyl-ACP methyl ester carboxylesterase